MEYNDNDDDVGWQFVCLDFIEMFIIKYISLYIYIYRVCIRKKNVSFPSSPSLSWNYHSLSLSLSLFYLIVNIIYP